MQSEEGLLRIFMSVVGLMMLFTRKSTSGISLGRAVCSWKSTFFLRSPQFPHSLVRYSSPEAYMVLDFSRVDFWKISLYGVCLVDCGYKFMRQSTVAPGRNSYTSYAQVDSGPRGRLSPPVGLERVFCCRNAAFFGLRPSGR